MSTVIETVHLTKQFKHVVAVNDLNLRVEEGDTFGFLGPNGAGKTTTIRMLTGFLKPTNGSIKIMGYDVFSDSKKAKEHIGLVPDMFGLYDVLNAHEHLKYYGELYGMTNDAIEANSDKVLKLVKLSEHKEKKIKEYSHGMRQRLVIAQALMNDPKLLFLDEPTVGLDPRGAYEVRNLIKELSKKGMTIFMSSHLLNEVQDICQTVGIIHYGLLVKLDKISNLTKELQVQKGNFIEIEVAQLTQPLMAAVNEIPGVQKVFNYYNTLKLQVEDTSIVSTIVSKLVHSGASILSVKEMKPDLEQIFLNLTEGTASQTQAQAQAQAQVQAQAQPQVQTQK
jgi:ABC-2 type transport system ATP-binding protein